MIMQTGTLPDKNTCFQCYHPPVFYWISAMVGNIAVSLGVSLYHQLKLFQFISCLYGILTVGVIYLILRKLPLSDFSRWIAFSTVCFLPRHIYMSAMHSNDTISYLFVALSLYVLLLAIEKRFALSILLVLSVVVSTALFTKYTAFALLPVIFVVFALVFFKNRIVPRKRFVLSLLAATLIPVLLLAAYVIGNMKDYGSPLPWNINQLDPGKVLPRDSAGLDFYSFKPWESITDPLLVPGKMHSFWTLVYTGMWSDNEPKFLYYVDPDKAWWPRYFDWLYGRVPDFPGEHPSLSILTRWTEAGLIALGIFPLLFMMLGIYRFLSECWKNPARPEETDVIAMSIFPVLMLGNMAIMVMLALRLPVFSSMKASYFLNSLPAFAVLLSLGLMRCENNKTLRRTIGAVFIALFALANLQILHFVLSMP